MNLLHYSLQHVILRPIRIAGQARSTTAAEIAQLTGLLPNNLQQDEKTCDESTFLYPIDLSLKQ